MAAVAPRRVMLDTNAASAAIRGASNRFRARLLATPPSVLCVSSITEGEMRYGLARRPDATRLAQVVQAFLDRVEVLPWESATAARYGALRAALEMAGRPIGQLDTLIAAHALATDSVLITHDKAFTRVADLATEDWED